MGREGEVVEQLLPGFTAKHPDVHVRVQQIPWSAAHEKLLTAYVGGAMQDVVQVGNTWLPELAALGALAPLDAARMGTAVDPADEFPGVVAATAIDGVRYGVPWYVDTRVLFYRRDLLRAAGYREPPATWSAWVEAMTHLARGHGERYAVLLPMTEWSRRSSWHCSAGRRCCATATATATSGAPRFERPSISTASSSRVIWPRVPGRRSRRISIRTSRRATSRS